MVIDVAGSISYDGSGDFVFYSDPKEAELAQELNRCRPRKSGVETLEKFEEKKTKHRERVQGDPDLQIKGNSMTQKFYAKHILPTHVNRLKSMEKRYSHHSWLQEDNDCSHGTRSDSNPAADVKLEHEVFTHRHSGNSPDCHLLSQSGSL